MAHETHVLIFILLDFTQRDAQARVKKIDDSRCYYWQTSKCEFKWLVAEPAVALALAAANQVLLMVCALNGKYVDLNSASVLQFTSAQLNSTQRI